MEDIKRRLVEGFTKNFKREPELFFFCPGRVNLIGEHIDYNGGKVLPCAITLGSFLAVAKNNDAMFRFTSLDFPEAKNFPVLNSYEKTGKEWFNYPLGVIHHLNANNTGGLDFLYYGNLPIGAGLSSSASIEIVTAFAFNTIFSLGIKREDLAILCKKVENEFIGVNSGIMDQFAVALGKKDNALLLDCETLEYELVPFEIGNHILAIINTNKARTLADSKYNERFAECMSALKQLQQKLPVKNLCDISPDQFEQYADILTKPAERKRALHVISENERVKKATVALKNGNIEEFGELMYSSHQSLKDLYEVSGVELDTIVDYCKTADFVKGARMTGAGFGGCAIALVKADRLDEFKKGVTSFYKKRIGYNPGVFLSKIGDGVGEMGSGEW